MTKPRLTKETVDYIIEHGLTARDENDAFYDGETGLYLLVTRYVSGYEATWHKIGCAPIGQYPEMSLASARKSYCEYVVATIKKLQNELSGEWELANDKA